MKEILRRCFSFLLIGLLLIKISAFHVYEHLDSLDSSQEHCEQCLLAINGPQSEGFMSSVFVSQELSIPVLSKKKIISSDFSFTNSPTFIILFSRPPPVQEG